MYRGIKEHNEICKRPQCGPHRPPPDMGSTCSTAGPLIPPSFPKPGGIKEILPVVGKPIKPIGWFTTF